MSLNHADEKYYSTPEMTDTSWGHVNFHEETVYEKGQNISNSEKNVIFSETILKCCTWLIDYVRVNQKYRNENFKLSSGYLSDERNQLLINDSAEGIILVFVIYLFTFLIILHWNQA